MRPSAWANKRKALRLRSRARWVRSARHEEAANLGQAATVLMGRMLMLMSVGVRMMVMRVIVLRAQPVR